MLKYKNKKMEGDVMKKNKKIISSIIFSIILILLCTNVNAKSSITANLESEKQELKEGQEVVFH